MLSEYDTVCYICRSLIILFPAVRKRAQSSRRRGGDASPMTPPAQMRRIIVGGPAPAHWEEAPWLHARRGGGVKIRRGDQHVPTFYPSFRAPPRRSGRRTTTVRRKSQLRDCAGIRRRPAAGSGRLWSSEASIAGLAVRSEDPRRSGLCFAAASSPEHTADH